jgi:hypothetical protein
VWRGKVGKEVKIKNITHAIRVGNKKIFTEVKKGG